MEPLASLLFTLGILLLLISWILLIIAARQDFAWTLCSIFLPPVAYFYGLFAWEKAKDAIMLAVLGWLLLFLQAAA